MQLGNVSHLLWRCLPHSLAHRLEHNGGYLLQGCRIFLLEESLRAEIVLVFHVHLIDFVPQFLVDGFRFHHVPAVSVLHYLGKTACRTCSTLHFLLYIYRVKNGCTAFHAYGFLHFLHTHVVLVAVVA